MSKPTRQKVVAIVGATATGKSECAVFLAERFLGEVISADSRQVYRGLTIGTNKITEKEKRGIPHHLLDVADPNKRFSAADFVQSGRAAIETIHTRGKIPFIAGGTGFYVDALLGKIVLPNVPPNKALREELEKKPTKELVSLLEKKDPRRAGELDHTNRTRLIRALEIAEELGSVPKYKSDPSLYTVLKIGLQIPRDKLKEKIRKRLAEDFKNGLVSEVQSLHEKGLSWERMEELGLQYRYVARFLQGEISEEEMREQLKTAIEHYAKRQEAYFGRDKDIHWFSPEEKHEIEKAVSLFLKS